jgi:uncharacterized delta-60 repeat protein
MQTDDALLLGDGRIIVIASALGKEMAAWRFLPDGDPDTSFGGDGQATVTFERSSAALAGALQPDGKLVLVGHSGASIAIVRLLPSGDPDTGFGSGGATTVRLKEKAIGVAVKIGSDGRIIVGASLVARRSRSPIGTALLRLHASGTPDESFGRQGVVTVGDQRFGDLTLDDQNSIVVGLLPAGLRGRTRFLVARYAADGIPDPTFAGDGRRRYIVKSLGDPSDVLIDPAGRILLALSGVSRRCFLEAGGVVRLTPDGELDTSFSGDGVALRTCGPARRMTLTDDGSIVVGGSIFAGAGSGEHYPTLSRLTPVGARDASFGDEGIVVAPPLDHYWSGTRGLLLQDDGKIVLVAGGIYAPGFAVGRFLST